MQHSGKPGRPSECTPELTSQVCEVIAQGNYRSVAARACGLHPETFTRWMREGRDPQSKYAGFRRAVIEAEAQTEATMVARVTVASQHTPGEARWWLAAKFPARWGRNNDEIKRLWEVVNALLANQAQSPVPAPAVVEGRSRAEGAAGEQPLRPLPE